MPRVFPEDGVHEMWESLKPHAGRLRLDLGISPSFPAQLHIMSALVHDAVVDVERTVLEHGAFRIALLRDCWEGFDEERNKLPRARSTLTIRRVERVVCPMVGWPPTWPKGWDIRVIGVSPRWFASEKNTFRLMLRGHFRRT